MKGLEVLIEVRGGALNQMRGRGSSHANERGGASIRLRGGEGRGFELDEGICTSRALQSDEGEGS